MVDLPVESNPRRWRILAVLCLSVFLVVVDNTIVNVALPSFSRDLHSSTSGLQWIVDGYSLPFAALLLAGGAVADRLGRKPVMQVALVGFTATSIWAAMATSTTSLIAARASMGVMAAFVFPATLAILTTVFVDPKERATAIGIWGATSGASVAVGPIAGGALLEHFWYGSVFLVNLPIALVTLVAGALVVPNSRAYTGARFDHRGLWTAVAGLTALVLTIIEGPTWGWGSAKTLTGFAVAAAVLVLWSMLELRVPAPMLDVRVFANRRFSAGAIAVAVAFCCLFGFIFLITEYFQLVRGYSSLSAGVHTLPFAICTAAMTPVGAVLALRFGARFVVSGGLLAFAVGLGVCATMPSTASYWAVIVPSMVAMATGLGFVTAPSTEAVMGSLHPDQVGAGAAVSNTTRELGGTLGVAVLGSVFASSFAPAAISALERSGVSAAVARASSSSVAASLTVASHLHDGSAAIHGTVAGFTSGLHAACATAVGIAVGGAIVVVVLLRGSASTQP